MTETRAHKQFMRYSLVGVASNAFCYGVFLALLSAHLSAVLANALCYVLGLALSYLGNRKWTFRSANAHFFDLARFGGAYALGFVVSIATMAVLSRIMAAPVAQLVTICVTAAIIFIALRLLGFGRSNLKERRAI